MARKTEGSVKEAYLGGWYDVQGTEGVALEPFDSLPDAPHSIQVLTDIGYIVHIEPRDGQFFVRCLQKATAQPTALSGITLAYCGESLKSILAAACYEAELLLTNHENAMLITRERARWVIS